jgi:hypothetical protein
MEHASFVAAIAYSAEWPHLAGRKGHNGAGADEALRDSRAVGDADRGSSESGDRLLYEPASSRTRSEVEQGPVEQQPDRAARWCIESVEFDEVRPESEASDKDREERRERSRTPLDRNHPRAGSRLGGSKADDRRFCEGHSLVATYPQLEVAGKAARLGPFLRDALSQPVCIRSPKGSRNTAQIEPSRHGQTKPHDPGGLVGYGLRRLGHGRANSLDDLGPGSSDVRCGGHAARAERLRDGPFGPYCAGWPARFRDGLAARRHPRELIEFALWSARTERARVRAIGGFDDRREPPAVSADSVRTALG